MFAPLLALCARIDAWLHARLGRPYGIVLTVGLTFEIVRRLCEAPERLGQAKQLTGLVLLILLNAALLVHQLAELGERVGRRVKPKSAEEA